jgi:zinc/manganese transport system permease protein
LIIAVLMPFGLGLGILFLALYRGAAQTYKFGLLTGQIMSVDNPQLLMLVIISAVVIAALVDLAPAEFRERGCEIARAKGLPVTGLSIAFASPARSRDGGVDPDR